MQYILKAVLYWKAESIVMKIYENNGDFFLDGAYLKLHPTKMGFHTKPSGDVKCFILC